MYLILLFVLAKRINYFIGRRSRSTRSTLHEQLEHAASHLQEPSAFECLGTDI